MKLLATLKSLLSTQEINQLAVANEIAIQQALANNLRQLSLKHLKESDSPVAKSFRGEYIQAGLGEYTNFIKKQSKPGEWGTYVEATALAELLGCNVIVTPVKNRQQQKPFCLYRASDENTQDKDIPTIHLYNSNNTHWYVNSNTQGDGNCLFNAFAQAIQQKVQATLIKEAAYSATATQMNNPNHFFCPNEISEKDRSAIEMQQAIELSIINKNPTPDELNQVFEQEKARIGQLPEEQQEQIKHDYILALKLATEDLAYVLNNVTSVKQIVSNNFEHETSNKLQF